jgi:hypothetical protein
MKRVIRRRVILDYLRPNGGWTRNPSEAWFPQDLQEALSAVQFYHLKDVDLVFYSSDRVPSEYTARIALTSQPA